MKSSIPVHSKKAGGISTMASGCCTCKLSRRAATFQPNLTLPTTFHHHNPFETNALAITISTALEATCVRKLSIVLKRENIQLSGLCFCYWRQSKSRPLLSRTQTRTSLSSTSAPTSSGSNTFAASTPNSRATVLPSSHKLQEHGYQYGGCWARAYRHCPRPSY